jgi:hypothetical protein
MKRGRYFVVLFQPILCGTVFAKLTGADDVLAGNVAKQDWAIKRVRTDACELFVVFGIHVCGRGM